MVSYGHRHRGFQILKVQPLVALETDNKSVIPNICSGTSVELKSNVENKSKCEQNTAPFLVFSSLQSVFEFDIFQ